MTKAYIKHIIGAPRRALERAHRLRARTLTACLSLALVLALVEPAAVLASVLPTDVVGGAAVSSSAALRAAAPDLDLASGMLVTSDGRVLWSRDASERRSIASITKIMTALVVLDGTDLDETLVVPAEATRVGESEAKLKVGERLTVRDALAAMMVKSANDAAVALAVHTAGSTRRFVELMNAKAAELGMAGSHFTNPHGLDEAGHYSTAEDVALMSRVVMAREPFRQIVRRKTVTVGTGADAVLLTASNELLGTYNGANGLKTGWTDEAGYCLVASAERGGIELYAIVLGTKSASSRFTQARRMLDWGFAHYRRVRVATSGSAVGTLTVSDYLDRSVLAQTSRDETATLFDLDGPLVEKPLLERAVRAPVARGQVLGTLKVTQGSRLVANVPLVADRDVEAPGFFERIGIALRRFWLRLFG